jgi:uncharacterized membrane protein YccF (DUF307 family)
MDIRFSLPLQTKTNIVNLLGNLIWLLFGGLLTCLGYVFGGFVLCLTIIGIPFGLQLFKLAPAVLMPFGKEVVDTPVNTGVLRLLLNILWILCGGIWLAAGHLIMGAILFITIIGIPFARQHFKLVEVSLLPFGKRIV